jgi:intein/homing endonuclease
MKRFTEEEKKWITENYKNKKIDEISKYLGRTKASIKAFMHKNGFKNNFNYCRSNNIGLEDERLCYLLGFIWADGHVNRKGYIELTILQEDAKQISPIIQHVQGFRKKQNNKLNRKPTISFICRDKDFVSKLLELDFNNKSYCEPSSILKNIPKENHYLFWRGFFDGDGCIYDQKTSKTKVSKRIEISGRYDYKWIELSNLLSNLGCTFVIKKSITAYGKNSIVKMWRMADIKTFKEYIYQDSGINGCLNRKLTKFY